MLSALDADTGSYNGSKTRDVVKLWEKGSMIDKQLKWSPTYYPPMISDEFSFERSVRLRDSNYVYYNTINIPVCDPICVPLKTLTNDIVASDPVARRRSTVRWMKRPFREIREATPRLLHNRPRFVVQFTGRLYIKENLHVREGAPQTAFIAFLQYP